MIILVATETTRYRQPVIESEIVNWHCALGLSTIFWQDDINIFVDFTNQRNLHFFLLIYSKDVSVTLRNALVKLLTNY